MITEWLSANLLTVWPQQHCSGPQTSEQLAVGAAWVQDELVGVTGLPDSLCLLHSDTNTQKQTWKRDTTSLACPQQEEKIFTMKACSKRLPFSYLLDISLKDEMERKCSLIIYDH